MSAMPAPVLAKPAPVAATPVEAASRWTVERAGVWGARQPWLVGANYLPANAINQLEMWQADSFDPARIDRELGWAQGLGMTTMRVFLHDALWTQDKAGFKRRIDRFLAIAARHAIKPLFVFFDSCWDPDYVLGPQRPPIPGVHNSGWVQSPGRAALVDPARWPHLEAYVKDIVGTFARDDRILGWDLWNEPDNSSMGYYRLREAANKTALVAEMIPMVFAWARSAHPEQPLTSGIWAGGDWSPGSPLSPIQRTQIEQSDIISFHNYDQPEAFEARVAQLKKYGRPLLCTEWMARGVGSNVDTVLPIARREGVGMINWGFVDGKSQTRFPWDSWDRPYTTVQPMLWFHDLLKPDGTPYRPREAETFRALTDAARQGKAAQ